MKKKGVEWLVEQICGDHTEQWQKEIEQAKAMESKERLKHLLFIGKVTETLGFDKVVELLKECNNESNT
jgi:hypothetical protein